MAVFVAHHLAHRLPPPPEAVALTAHHQRVDHARAAHQQVLRDAELAAVCGVVDALDGPEGAADQQQVGHRDQLRDERGEERLEEEEAEV